MWGRTGPQQAEDGAEARRREATALALGLGGLLLAVWAGRNMSGAALLGAGLCALPAALLRFSRVPLGWVDRGLLLTLGVAFLWGLFRGWPHPPLLLSAALLALGTAAFALLRAGAALRLTLLLFVPFAWAGVRGGFTPEVLAVAALLVLVGGAILLVRRVTAERVEAALTQHLNATDVLTGVLNRPAMYALLRRALAGEAPGWGQERGFGVVLLDLDYFEQINARLGHAQGDAALVAVARALQEEVRSGDAVARWEGDAFFVLLPGVDERGARAEAYRLWLAVRRVRVAGQPVTASLGVALGGEVGSLEALLQLVTERLHVAKASGRDRVCLPEKPLPLLP